MRRLVDKMDQLLIRGKMAWMEKKEGVDQTIIMFIIIAVAAGICGLLYIFGTKTLLPNFQTKVTNLINGWFDHN